MRGTKRALYMIVRRRDGEQNSLKKAKNEQNKPKRSKFL